MKDIVNTAVALGSKDDWVRVAVVIVAGEVFVIVIDPVN